MNLGSAAHQLRDLGRVSLRLGALVLTREDGEGQQLLCGIAWKSEERTDVEGRVLWGVPCEQRADVICLYYYYPSGTGTEGGDVRMQEKTAIDRPSREAWDRPYPRSLRKEPTLPTPRFWTCSLQNWGTINFDGLSHPIFGTLLRQP